MASPKKLPHSAQLALERMQTAAAKYQAAEANERAAKLALRGCEQAVASAKNVLAAAQVAWEREGDAFGLQEKDLVNSDYTVLRDGVLLMEEEPKVPAATNGG